MSRCMGLHNGGSDFFCTFAYSASSPRPSPPKEEREKRAALLLKGTKEKTLLLPLLLWRRGPGRGGHNMVIWPNVQKVEMRLPTPRQILCSLNPPQAGRYF